MIRSEFSSASRIILGDGVSAELPTILQALGQHVLLVESGGARARGGAAAQLAAQLEAAGLVVARIVAQGEPTIAAVEAAANTARAALSDCVVAIGGGRVIDTAKAVAALAANPGSALDYMETIGSGRALEHPALAVVAVPTTAGAGSEVTRNAVVRSPAHGAKASIRDTSLYPRVALVDPLLTHDLAPDVTAACGMDALTQLIEAFVSRRAGPLTDGLCREGLVLAARSLRAAVEAPTSAARSDMSAAALLSGMALANAGLGAVHGIAAPLGGSFPAPHGAACAALLAPITAANLRALQRDAQGGPALARYSEVARLLGLAGDLEQLPIWLGELCRSLGIPGLAAYGLSAKQIPALTVQAARSSSTRSNPVHLSEAELAEAIAAAVVIS
jgi:alcohol dehydrogenase class IV